MITYFLVAATFSWSILTETHTEAFIYLVVFTRSLSEGINFRAVRGYFGLKFPQILLSPINNKLLKWLDGFAFHFLLGQMRFQIQN